MIPDEREPVEMARQLLAEIEEELGRKQVQADFLRKLIVELEA